MLEDFRWVLDRFSLRSEPRQDRIKLRNDQRRREFVVLTYHDALSDKARLLQLTLNLLGSNIFSAGSLKDLFLPICDFQKRPVQLAHITRVKPALRIDRFLGQVWTPIIPHHDVRAAIKNLAVIGNLDFASWNNRSDRPQLMEGCLGPIHRDHRRRLGRSIPFPNGNSGCPKYSS